MKANLFRICVPALVLILVLASCGSPLGANFSTGTRGSISLSIEGAALGGGARTLAPDIAGMIAKYRILFQKSGSPDVTATIVGTQTVVSGLEPGRWSVTVSARSASGTQLATGSASVLVAAGAVNAANVVLAAVAPGSTGTGIVDIRIKLPNTSNVDYTSLPTGFKVYFDSGNLSFISGEGVPGQVTGLEGDLYFDTLSADSEIYKKIAHWTVSGSLSYGTSAPTAGVGTDGDLYVNTTDWVISQFITSDWSPLGTALNGGGEPDSSLGAVGDLYADTATWTLWEKGLATWVLEEYGWLAPDSNGSFDVLYQETGVAAGSFLLSLVFYLDGGSTVFARLDESVIVYADTTTEATLVLDPATNTFRKFPAPSQPVTWKVSGLQSSGSGVPTETGTETEGELYVDTSTWNIYKYSSPTWASINTTLSGSGTPDVALGYGGDLYVDTLVASIYEKTPVLVFNGEDGEYAYTLVEGELNARLLPVDYDAVPPRYYPILTWTPVEGVSSYARAPFRGYRILIGEGITLSPYDTSYEDTSWSAGPDPTVYTLEATNSAGTVISTELVQPAVPASPSAVWATQGGVITWDTVEAATGYRIYADADGEIIQLKDNPSYIVYGSRAKFDCAAAIEALPVLQYNPDYLFSVRALIDDQEGDYGNWAVAMPISIPTGIAITASSTTDPASISVSWNPVTVAETYNLYAANASSEETLLQTGLLSSESPYSFVELLAVLPKGTSYRFTLTALIGNEESAYGNWKSNSSSGSDSGPGIYLGSGN